MSNSSKSKSVRVTQTPEPPPPKRVTVAAVIIGAAVVAFAASAGKQVHPWASSAVLIVLAGATIAHLHKRK